MNRTHIRIFSLLLSLTIVIGVCPITAFATSQTAAESTATEDIQLPTAPGGENETVNVTVTVTPNDETGEIKTEKETANGGYTTVPGGNDVTYNEITVTLPGKEAGADDKIISSDSSYTSENGNYHAVGGKTTETVTKSDTDVDDITINIIKDGNSAAEEGSSGSFTGEVTVPTHEGDKLKSEDAANYDQTTVKAEEDRTATATVGETTVKVGDPVNADSDAVANPDADYYYHLDNNYYNIDNEASFGAVSNVYLYWEVVDGNNNVVESLGTPVDSNAGTWNIALKNDETGEVIKGLYCVDWDTGTANGKGYQMVNLEDVAGNDGYYSVADAAHLRAILKNGYDWSVDSNEEVPGTESLDKFKTLLNNALENESENGDLTTAGITSEFINDLSRNDAAAITQIALWQYANRITVDNGNKLQMYAYKDGKINNQYTALVKYLASLTDYGTKDETQIISEGRYVDDMDIVIGSMVKDTDKEAIESANSDDNDDNDYYNVDLKFSLKVTPSEKNDDLIVRVLDSIGTELKAVRIAGNNKEGESYEKITVDSEGYYTLKDLQLQENSDTTFNLKLEGVQYLEEGVYVFQSRIDDEKGSTSQNLIGKFEGEAAIDLSMQFDLTFNVEEGTVTTTREWRKEWYDTTGDDDDDDGDPTVSVEGEKTWVYDKDDDTAKSLIPEEIIVNLLADGEVTRSKTVKADRNGDWKYSFTGLPKYHEGEVIVYTVQEVVVEGFTATYDGYNITNTYTGNEETKKPVEEKTGDDDDDSDRIPDGGTPGSNVPDDLDNIPDGMPLTNVPKTGDSSGLWVALTALCGAGLLTLTATGKKREEEA